MSEVKEASEHLRTLTKWLDACLNDIATRNRWTSYARVAGALAATDPKTANAMIGGGHYDVLSADPRLLGPDDVARILTSAIAKATHNE